MKSAFLISLFASIATSVPVAQAADRSLERLFGVEISADEVAFKVASGGCVTKGHFRLVQREGRPPILELRRLGFDPCEAYLPFGEWIRYTYAELGLPPGTPLQIGNPVGKWPRA